MLAVAETCAYPLCGRSLAPPASSAVRLCAVGHAAMACPACGAANRLAARLCRRCRASLSLPDVGATGYEAEAAIVLLPGSFRRPPLLWAGSAVGVDTGGKVQSVALAAGARPFSVAELPPEAGANRSVIVSLESLGGGHPRLYDAPVLVAVHTAGVDAVVLATGEVVRLHTASAGAPLAVNDGANSAGLRGVAASGTHFAFAERSESGVGAVSLAVRGFAADSPAERVFSLAGEHVAGPVWSGGVFAMAGAEAVGVYDPGSRRVATAELPRGFEPMLFRTEAAVRVHAGTIPLCAGRGGSLVVLAGTRNGLPGLLRLDLETGAQEFEPLGRGASLSGNPDGTLALAGNDEVRVLGAAAEGSSRVRRARLQFGMPAAVSRGMAAWFAEENHRGLHRLVLEADSGARGELIFEDAACEELSAVAPMFPGYAVAAPYFVSGENFGVRFAVWNRMS